MNKTLLKDFAINSREDLMNQIRRKLSLFYISEEFNTKTIGDLYELTSSTSSKTLRLSADEFKKRETLVRRYNELRKLGGNAEEQIVEEAAYTWFNRLVAIRYMELHNYLPLGKNNESLDIRVLSSNNDDLHPEILKYSNLTNSQLDIAFNAKKYGELSNDNGQFKYVLRLVCDKLKTVFPNVFGDATEFVDILIPENLLTSNSFLDKLIQIPVDNFDEVEIIGWLYQYYNSAEKKKAMDKKGAYKKNQIPYVTQLFTPDWIVKYMVENSLGKYWLEHGGDAEITKNWKYYIKTDIEKKNRLKPTDITFIDPCCGSGHILVYAFEVFYQIYESAGYAVADIPSLILNNNIYGLDIDDRAGQLSVLSLLLKAREKDAKLFSKTEITENLNVMSLQESHWLDEGIISDFPKELQDTAKYLRAAFNDAKEIGSLLLVEPKDYYALAKFCNDNPNDPYMQIASHFLGDLVKEANILSDKYDIVVTNPPYLPSSKQTPSLKKYVSKQYENSKADLCTAFMQNRLLSGNGYLGMINMHSWMFISTYERLRGQLLASSHIVSMLHLGSRAFEEISGEVVQTTSFIISNGASSRNSIYIRLVDEKDSRKKEEAFFNALANGLNKYEITDSAFNNIPGHPIVYWASDRIFDIFKNEKKAISFGEPRTGIKTGDNDKFLRLWWEVIDSDIKLNATSNDDANKSGKQWFPYNKGGSPRKWYGNEDYIINWKNNGAEILTSLPGDSRTFQDYPAKFKFKQNLSCSHISPGIPTFRLKDNCLFDIAGLSYYANSIKTEYLLGLFNTRIVSSLLSMLNPTLNLQGSNLSQLPVILDNSRYNGIISIVEECVDTAKADWDSFETSWDFKTHPLITFKGVAVKDSFSNWKEFTEKQFNQLKANEEELNRIFIDIYGLQDELTPEVADKDITIHKADEKREIKSLISYAVGCMFGRYSLDAPGLIYAGGDFNENKYQKFPVDKDNIIPIADSEEVYYNDDIVGRFKEFIKTAYGEKTLNENLSYIADVLGRKNTESPEDTIRRYFVNDFFADHVKTYQKRPIYWLFDSGKKNGFKALVYLHRYNPQLVAKIRTEYFHKTQNNYTNRLDNLASESNAIKKNALEKDLREKIAECKEYDEELAHIANQQIKLDLDDGVKVNYAKLQDVLARIK